MRVGKDSIRVRPSRLQTSTIKMKFSWAVALKIWFGSVACLGFYIFDYLFLKDPKKYEVAKQVILWFSVVIIGISGLLYIGACFFSIKYWIGHWFGFETGVIFF